MPKAIAMGDPRHFSVRGGANPHTRNLLGIRKRVDPDRARLQWHALARALIAHGTAIYVIAPHPDLTGLVYPANAGFLFPLSGSHRIFHLANLLPTRAAEREVYRPFIRAMGFETRDVVHRFEGEADFFPAGRFMIFTYGRIERQRFALRFGIPPWRRIYGFRSERDAIDELQQIVGARPILALELALEAHYHGDTVLCSFGPEREFLLAYMPGLRAASHEPLKAEFGRDLIELSERDGALYAANSFQADDGGKLYLFLPEGVSDGLLSRIRERGVEPVLIDASEFLAKGGGSIKCMILDLGQVSALPPEPSAVEFREQRSYAKLFGPL
jgi:N-dimethylarginine dimethylaminohydrolase